MSFTALFPPSFTIIIKQQPEDFRVDEIMEVSLDGEGEHQWLKIKKRDANTEWVAGQLAKIAGITRKDVGFAGLKDRHAVTTQWFSLHVPGRHVEAISEALPEGVELMEESRHSKKLRRGVLSGNRFTLILRDCKGDAELFAERVNTLATLGMPNYFGQQRFGHEGNNLSRALAWFRGEFKPKKRPQKSLYLSAARSFLFNEILSARVEQGTWNDVMSGDVYQLNGSHSWFVDDGQEAYAERISTHDIHPTCALWGRGRVPSLETVLALETSIADQYPEICQGLENNGLQQDRRAARVIPKEVSLSAIDDQTYELQFVLPAGAYATVFLENCCEYEDVSGGGR